MAKVIENVKTLNSVARTAIFVVLLCGFSYGTWFCYDSYLKPGLDAKNAKADLEQLRVQFDEQREMYTKLQTDYDAQKIELAETHKKNQRLQTSMKLLKVDKRMARVDVLKKSINEKGETTLKVRFTEMDRNGKPIGSPREFDLKGEKLYVDCWIVNFDDHYIENSDALRACSLCVFKSIFGELDGLNGGYSLDKNGSNPVPAGVYRLAGQNEFEQQIWDQFWSVANDPKKQSELGIRKAFGQANYMLGEEGKSYSISLRASGGASIDVISDD